MRTMLNTRKMLTIAVLVIAHVVFVYPVYGEERVESMHFTISTQTFQEYNELSAYPSVEAFLQEAERDLDAIVTFLGAPDWQAQYADDQTKIQLAYASKGPSHVEGGYSAPMVRIPRVYLNSTAKFRIAPICHEVTHLILLDYTSHTLREGLASYVQEEVCDQPFIFTLGYPVHAAAKTVIHATDFNSSVIESIGTPGIPGRSLTAAMPDREYYYILTYSFTTYLLETCGLEPILQLYHSSNLLDDYVQICQASLSDLRQQWLDMLAQTADEPMTFAEWKKKVRQDIKNRFAP